MDQKVAIYIQAWDKGHQQGLKSLADLGYSVMVSAELVQICPWQEEFLNLFPAGRLQILSTDVDDQFEPMQVALTAATSQEFSHLLVVNCFDENSLAAYKKTLESLEPDSQQSWVFVPQRESKTSTFIERSLDLGDQDFRRFKSRNGLYALEQVNGVTFKKDKFNSLRILIHMLRKGSPIEAVEVNSKCLKEMWQGYNRGVLAFYDLWLLTLSSFYNNNKPKHSALSFSMGAFIACTPFYGLQTFLIFSCAFLFRLNFPIAFLGSQISLPPLYTLIVPVQMYVGFSLTGRSFQYEGSWLKTAQTHFSSWLVGSLVVGALLSGAMGLMWWMVAARRLRAKQTHSVDPQ